MAPITLRIDLLTCAGTATIAVGKTAATESARAMLMDQPVAQVDFSLAREIDTTFTTRVTQIQTVWKTPLVRPQAAASMRAPRNPIDPKLSIALTADGPSPRTIDTTATQIESRQVRRIRTIRQNINSLTGAPQANDAPCRISIGRGYCLLSEESTCKLAIDRAILQ